MWTSGFCEMKLWEKTTDHLLVLHLIHLPEKLLHDTMLSINENIDSVKKYYWGLSPISIWYVFFSISGKSSANLGGLSFGLRNTYGDLQGNVTYNLLSFFQ